MNELNLFSGIGGFALGLGWAGQNDDGTNYFETVAFCEQDRKCRKLLKELWPGKKIYIDVETLTYERLKRDGIPAIDLITGGFPYRFNRWETEPPVCGVAHGFPGRVDRLKQLGNSIVPQIAEMIGKVIMEIENAKV